MCTELRRQLITITIIITTILLTVKGYGQDSIEHSFMLRTIDSTDLVLMCYGNVGTIYYREYFDTKDEDLFFVKLKNYRHQLLAEGCIKLTKKEEYTLTGEWSFYHDNGKLRRKGNYIKNEKRGDWVDYDREGTEIYRTYYLDSDHEVIENIILPVFDVLHIIQMNHVFGRNKNLNK